MVDASDKAVGAVLELLNGVSCNPILFFSRKIFSTEQWYSTFGRSLLAIYLAIKHYRYLVEAECFHKLVDHKPLTYAIKAFGST